MQIPKTFLVACAAAVSFSAAGPAQNADTEALTRAREAMRQKLAELDNESAAESEDIRRARQALRETLAQPTLPAAPAVAPAAPLAPAQPVAPAPVNRTTAVTITMEEPIVAADPEAIQKAREATRQKLWQLHENPGGPDSPEIARAREALRQAMQQPETSTPITITAPDAPAGSAPAVSGTATTAEQIKREEATAAAQRRAKRNEAVKPSQYPALTGPASPLPADRQSRLAELLRRYRADELTPEQYHTERAKILSEP